MKKTKTKKFKIRRHIAEGCNIKRKKLSKKIEQLDKKFSKMRPKDVQLRENIDVFDIGISEELAFGTPNTGDRLIKESNIGNHAIINERQFATPLFIVDGYFQNANNIIKSLRNENNYAIKNTMIYPALNSFRQYLELTMKDSIRRFKIPEGLIKRNEAGHSKTHSLVTLWNELYPIIKDPHPAEDNAIDLAVENLINEFNQLDKGSYNFRYYYDINKEGNIELLFKDGKVIDIENLYQIMHKLHNYFEGISDLSYVANDK
jgi:hypothetical protein